ncbi:MAG: dihydrofolate reductase family protein [Devosia ginsengisoli]|nr:dihydrofolate reductase family protein [Devosia ginsengisoli]MCR6671235.1 dihydrofolate reductase family protein [Devosia ginsengisoli]
MFGLHAHPNDPDWRGWWGEEPPFRVPVFVLTHKPRPPIEMEGGTTFHFLSTALADALQQAARVANGKDIRIGGGLTIVRDALKAGLVDRLHVAITPILLGRGIRLWDDLRGLEAGYTVKAETAESGTVHLTFQRQPGAGDLRWSWAARSVASFWLADRNMPTARPARVMAAERTGCLRDCAGLPDVPRVQTTTAGHFVRSAHTSCAPRTKCGMRQKLQSGALIL